MRSALLDAERVETLLDVFGILADPNRLRLLSALLEGGELCVCDLAGSVAMAESTTSHALRVLRVNRVVKVRRAGRVADYSLTDGHVRVLIDGALAHVAHGDGYRTLTASESTRVLS